MAIIHLHFTEQFLSNQLIEFPIAFINSKSFSLGWSIRPLSVSNIFFVLALIVSIFFETSLFAGEAVNQRLFKATEAVEKSILDKLGQGFNSFDSWGLNNVELGLEEGLITKAIFSVNRTIERNEKSRWDYDRYLVKDELKVGFRLGFGYVVSGDVSFTRKYTLIYGVKTRLEGTIRNKFLVNLFLPYQVHKNILPPQYVLIIEDQLEGRGRFKIGGTLQIPVGLEATASEIKLSRNFMSKQSADKMVIMEDHSLESKLSAEIFLSLYLFDIPMIEGSISKGKLKRKILEIDLEKTPVPNMNQGMRNFLLSGDISKLHNEGKLKVIESKFVEKLKEADLFGLASRKVVSRLDHFFLWELPAEERKEYYQLLELNYRKWYLPTTGETHWSRLTVSGQVKNGDLTHPFAHIGLRVLDYRTVQKELKDYYLPLSAGISGMDDFFQMDPFLPSVKENWDEVSLSHNLYIFEDGLNAIMNSSEEDVWKHFSEIMKWPFLQNKTLRAKVDKHPFKMRKYRKKMKPVKKFLADLSRSQKSESVLEKLRYLKKGFKHLVFKERQTYAPEYLALLRQMSEGDFFVTGTLVIPEDKLKHQVRPVIMNNSTGVDRTDEFFSTPFIFYDVQQIWDIFL